MRLPLDMVKKAEVTEKSLRRGRQSMLHLRWAPLKIDGDERCVLQSGRLAVNAG